MRLRLIRPRLHLLSVTLVLSVVLGWPLAAAAQGVSGCKEGSGTISYLCDLEGAYLQPGSKDRLALVDKFASAEHHLTDVLVSQPYRMANGSCGQHRVGLPTAVSYCWPGADQTNSWMPQGIAGEAEAGWPEVTDADITVMSAYAKMGGTERARISIIDNTTGRYVHVTPVEPFGGKIAGCTYGSGVSLCHLRAHAGGLAWRGKYLYMAGTNDVHVFDLTRFIATKQGYLLPEIGRYYEHVPGSFRVSFVSVDASRHELVLGTYDRTVSSQRLLHWPLRTDGSLASVRPRYGVTVAGNPALRLQGVAVHNGRYYLSQSGTSGVRDRLYTATVNGPLQSYGWVKGAEDLYLDPSRGVLWGGGEFTGDRSVVAVDITRYMHHL